MYIKVEKPFSLKLYVKYLPGIFHYPSPKYLMQYSVPKSPENIATIASVSGDKKKKKKKSPSNHTEERRKASISQAPSINEASF